MASSGRGARRGGAGRGDGERRSVVQAMRAANRGRGRQRSPAFELSANSTGSSAASFQQLLKQARASGSLNLTSRGLEEVPEQIFNLLGGSMCVIVYMQFGLGQCTVLSVFDTGYVARISWRAFLLQARQQRYHSRVLRTRYIIQHRWRHGTTQQPAHQTAVLIKSCRFAARAAAHAL